MKKYLLPLLIVLCVVCLLIPAEGSAAEVIEAVAPTCTETGLSEGSQCSVCGEILVAQKEVAALGHDEVIDEAEIPPPAPKKVLPRHPTAAAAMRSCPKKP